MRRRPGEEANEISLVGSRVDVPDIRYTLRGFRRSPGSFVAVISLALGSAARRRTELCLQENAYQFQRHRGRLSRTPGSQAGGRADQSPLLGFGNG